MNTMKKSTIFFVSILLALSIYSCKYDFIIPVEVPVIDNGGKPISFSTQVSPIFSTGDKCTECHKTGGQAPDLSPANAYAQIVPKYVNTTTPNQSKIYSVPGSSAHSWRGYTPTEAATVLAWITEGAKNN